MINIRNLLGGLTFMGIGATTGGLTCSSLLSGVGFVLGGPVVASIGFSCGCFGGLAIGALSGLEIDLYIVRRIKKEKKDNKDE